MKLDDLAGDSEVEPGTAADQTQAKNGDRLLGGEDALAAIVEALESAGFTERGTRHGLGEFRFAGESVVVFRENGKRPRGSRMPPISD